MMTSRDQELVVALCGAVRFFSLEQLAREFWTGGAAGKRQARKRISRLEGYGFLSTIQALVRPLLPLENPVLVWAPPERTPDFAGVSRELRRRWKEPANLAELIHATPRAQRIFGGIAYRGVKNLCQTTHDLHVAEIFLRYRRQGEWAGCVWVGEDEIARSGDTGAVPDAALRSAAGRYKRFIEFGGAYAEDRVAHFHEHCLDRQVPYELW
ncbi:MAG: hypothetical protein K2X38_23080 [Gemmataceae bacterium]|nr:hypothetical protein [Gemmataceae bacterium]